MNLLCAGYVTFRQFLQAESMWFSYKVSVVTCIFLCANYVLAVKANQKSLWPEKFVYTYHYFDLFLRILYFFSIVSL